MVDGQSRRALRLPLIRSAIPFFFLGYFADTARRVLRTCLSTWTRMTMIGEVCAWSSVSRVKNCRPAAPALEGYCGARDSVDCLRSTTLARATCDRRAPGPAANAGKCRHLRIVTTARLNTCKSRNTNDMFEKIYCVDTRRRTASSTRRMLVGSRVFSGYDRRTISRE